jgi:hypothetical protein
LPSHRPLRNGVNAACCDSDFHNLADMAANGQSSAKPAHFSLSQIIRPNILQLTPYRCARDDYSSGILLDANENALGPSFASSSSASLSSSGTDLDDLDLDSLALHRYPDPNQIGIKKRIAEIRNLTGGPENVFLGVGSDEVIDLLFRVVCTPGKDSVLGEYARALLLLPTRFAQCNIAYVKVTPPTYGMYSVCAAVNDVGVVKINLDVEDGPGRFQPKVDEVNPETCSLISGPWVVVVTTRRLARFSSSSRPRKVKTSNSSSSPRPVTRLGRRFPMRRFGNSQTIRRGTATWSSTRRMSTFKRARALSSCQ